MTDADHKPTDDGPSNAPDDARVPRPRRRALKWLAWTVGVMVLGVVIAVGAALTAIHTERGTRVLWRVATSASAGALSGTFDGGSLATGVRLRDVAWRRGGTEIAIDRFGGQWALTRHPWRFSLDYLRIGTIDARFAPSGKTTQPALPEQLTLPLQLDVRLIQIAKIRLHNGASTTELSDLTLHATSDGRHHRLVLDTLGTPYGTASANVALDGVRPFALSGDAEFAGDVRQHTVQVGAHVSGSLENVVADVNASGMQLTGTAHIEATPFADVPLKRVTLSADHVDPRTFSAGAPQADLALRAQLQPVAPVGGAPEAALVVAGDVSIVNAKPGLPARRLLPLIDVRAKVRLDAKQQSMSDLAVRLVKGTTLTGGGTLRDGVGRLDLRIANLDPNVFEPSVRAMRLGGPITIALDDGTQNIVVDLADPAAKLRAQGTVSLDSKRIGFDRVRLTLGAGRAELSGALQHDTHSSYALKAALSDFDPLALMAQNARPSAPQVKGRQAGGAQTAGAARAKATGAKPGSVPVAGPIEARVTGTLNATGMLAPTLTTKADFTLRNSVYNGLPLTGAGTIQLAGSRILPSNARVNVAGNDVELRGSFGTPRDRLTFRIDAPVLERLGFGVAGAAKAEGDVTGSFAHPNVVADYQADGVVFGENRIGHAAGRVELRDGARGAMVATLDARDVQAASAQFPVLSARLDGTRASHTLRASGNGVVDGHKLDFNVAASGKLTDTRDGTSWDGTITQLENRGMPALKLESPVSVSAAARRLTLGPTRLTLERASLDLKSLVYERGTIRSSGSLTNVDVARLLQIREELTHQPPPFRTDLVFDGDWNFSLAQTAAGYVQLKRRSGDVTIDAGRGVAALGIGDVAARVEFTGGNQLTATAHAQAARLGMLDANLHVPMTLRDGVLGIADDAPVTGALNVDMPSLQTTGGLLGPTYLFDGQLLLKLSVAGQAAHPKFSGTLNGDGLSATLVDQGITLKDGIVRVVLSENLVEFRQVEFRGASGTLSANGKIMLDQSNPDLSAHVVADKLQVFASPDRRLSLSGSATIANAGAQGGMAIDGKFAVDKALFDLPEQSAPSLSDDVVVVRPDGTVKRKTQPPTAVAGKPVSPFAPRANIDIDLGQDFRFRGAGADLGLRGTINVVSAPGVPLRAVGDVRVTEGSTYSSFGRKLGIENGYFTFNGPVNNPGINILAMRRNQDVEAGVQVSGTLQAPKVRLVSEPNVNDNEKLSWLLLGHGTDTGANLGQQGTMDAAFALLGSVTGKRIAQTVGLDEVTVGQSEVGLIDPQVVLLSKALTERFVLGYEQGLQTSNNVFKLTANLSRFWAITSYAGTFNGVDLTFSRRFDGFWKK